MKNFFILLILLSSAFIINSFAQKAGWEVVSSDTKEELNSIYFSDYQTGYACGNSGVVVKSVDSGKTWQSLQSPVSCNLNDIFSFDQDCFIAVGDSATVIGTWYGGDSLYVAQIRDSTADIYSVSFTEDQGVFYGVFGASLQTIVGVGSQYCLVYAYNYQSELSLGGFWDAYMLTSEIGFVAGENSIFQPILGRTTDHGNNWEFVSFYLDGNEGKATGVDFTDQLVGYISAMVWNGQGAIAKTTDSGNNWTISFFNNPLWDIDFPISEGGQIGYCVGDSGTILKTYNAGVTWNHQISGSNEKLNKVYFLDENFGFALGENGMILRTTTGGGPVTNIEEEDLYPYSIELGQNYPNPFNPSTSIKFRIAEFGFVSLKVYDVLGNEIATLVNEEKPTGIYEVEFDATSLTSGIYFYKLQADLYIETKKMVFMK
jgi:photosystem II stability/assembly factor-like uncharacterized protein